MIMRDHRKVAEAILATRDRIERTQLDTENCKAEQTGVRRTAAHIADALSPGDIDGAAAFLILCGYGASRPAPVDDPLEGMPGMQPQTYEEFSRSCARQDGR